jgi:centrosomal protein CEP41
MDFILLDLREKEDYDLYHIREARSFPATNISRDKFTAELLILVYNVNLEK